VSFFTVEIFVPKMSFRAFIGTKELGKQKITLDDFVNHLTVYWDRQGWFSLFLGCEDMVNLFMVNIPNQLMLDGQHCHLYKRPTHGGSYYLDLIQQSRVVQCPQMLTVKDYLHYARENKVLARIRFTIEVDPSQKFPTSSLPKYCQCKLLLQGSCDNIGDIGCIKDADLNVLSREDLQRVAKSINLPTTGDRAMIISRIEDFRGLTSN